MDLILRCLLIVLCLFSLIFFIFGLGKIDFNTDVDSVLAMYKKELKRTKKEIDEGNKMIDEIEKEIFICKKKLNRYKKILKNEPYGLFFFW